jgi:alpha-L-fucosidase
MEKKQPIQQQNTDRLAWYEEAKFGLFIHWGAYSVAGAEASWPAMAPDLSEAMFGTKVRISEAEYKTLPARFNPVDFDADEWVRIAKEAGMKYIIITTKHHDGFCMFDAPGTDYKITKTPFSRDVCKELSQACARAGMPLGFYYSPPDMNHPGYRDTRKPATKNWLGEPKRKQWAEYLDYMESHIRKLLTDYGHVSIMWFDGLANHDKYDTRRFHKLVHELSPDTLINDRLGDGYDYVTPEQFIPKKGIPVKTHKPPSSNAPDSESFFRIVVAMFKLPGIRGWIRKQMQKYQDGSLELTVVPQEPYPSPQDFQPWETCMTMGTTWGYNPHETQWKSPQGIVRNLVEVVSKGGNYLLNVGPTDKGIFPAEAVERLEYVGKWMKTNNQAVYGTTYTPLNGLSWGRVTRKDNSLYLHVFEWPADGKLVVPEFKLTAKKIYLIKGEKVSFSQTDGGLTIELPAQAPDPDVSVVCVEFDDPSQALTHYSPTKEYRTPLAKYMKSQAIINFVVNSIINGLLALSTYIARPSVPYTEAAIDILITVFIIAFLVSWIGIGGARSEVIKGNLAIPERILKGIRLPKSAALGGLYVSLASVLLFGLVFMDGLLYLFAPVEVTGFAYFIIKTIYTGLCAAFASALSILSVVSEGKRG